MLNSCKYIAFKFIRSFNVFVYTKIFLNILYTLEVQVHLDTHIRASPAQLPSLRV